MSGSRGQKGPATSRESDREIETSGSEKVLAVVLTIFIAIGAIWGYFKLDEVGGGDPAYRYAPTQQLLDGEERAAIQDHRQATRSLQRARNERAAAVRTLEFRREAYRTALDAGRSSAELEAGYEAAQDELASASKELASAAGVAAETRPPAQAAEDHLFEQQQASAQKVDDERAEHDRTVFLLRLALLIFLLAASYRLLSRLRSRHSRYLPAALALIGATAILACVMAVDYADGYLAFDEVGPLAISIAGVALTLVAFVALQRFLAKRIPVRRVRRGECPFCGFPLREGKPHCEGCGRAVIASCSSCQQDRRVGTPRCGSCGNP